MHNFDRSDKLLLLLHTEAHAKQETQPRIDRRQPPVMRTGQLAAGARRPTADSRAGTGKIMALPSAAILLHILIVVLVVVPVAGSAARLLRSLIRCHKTVQSKDWGWGIFCFACICILSGGKHVPEHEQCTKFKMYSTHFLFYAFNCFLKSLSRHFNSIIGRSFPIFRCCPIFYFTQF